MSRQIVIELGKLLRRTEPCSLYMLNTKIVKIVSLLSLVQAIVEQANSLENRSNTYCICITKFMQTHIRDGKYDLSKSDKNSSS